MDLYIILLYCFAFIVPLSIFFRSFGSTEPRIRKCRLLYAIPSILTIFVDVVFIVLILQQKITAENSSAVVQYAPLLLCILSFFVYLFGKKKERLLQADVLVENAVDIMDTRNNGRNQNNFLDISTEELNKKN